jgi:hypothetical protein
MCPISFSGAAIFTTSKTLWNITTSEIRIALNNSMVRVLLDNPTDHRLIKKYAASSGTTEFATVYTTAHPQFTVWDKIQRSSWRTVTLASILILSPIYPLAFQMEFPLQLSALNFYTYFPCPAGVLHVPTSSSPCCGRPIIFSNDYAYEL